jgi:hypothetical protein
MNRREALRRTAAITGLAVTGPVGIGFLNGCKPTGDPDWQPVFLTQEEVRTVTAVADIIIPGTDTPGAIELHVPEFIDVMLNDCFSEELQVSFRKEMKNFREKIASDYSKPFDMCSMDEKQKIISVEEKVTYDAFNQSGKRSFYINLKQIVLLGYFSSEFVMTNLLNYTPVATRYEGCIPLNQDDRLYVDNNV